MSLKAIQKNAGIVSFAALAALAVPTQALAGSSLKSNDYVGISFWLITMALIASTVFFFLESLRVDGKWKTSLTVSGLVTMIAAIHYMYMREVWVTEGTSPTVFRYIDWLITVPLLMIEFYLILAAITKVPVGVFWRLMIGTLVMLVGGYLGEAGLIGVWPGFIIGMLGWAYIRSFCTTIRSIGLQLDALDCDGWLGDLSDRVLLRISDRQQPGRQHEGVEYHLQPRRRAEQDRFRPDHLGGCVV
jgi:Bacteriorhodopsin-like protein